MTAPKAPTVEIGYAQVPMMSASGRSSMNWWMADDETTPELRWPQSVYVYDQMRTQDSQVGSVLSAVTTVVCRTPWRIDPAGARPEVVHLVAEDLGLPIVGQDPQPLPRTRDRFSWSEHLNEALLMLPFGHMYFEQVYRIVDGLARLRKLGARMPKTIEEIEVARDGGLISITQYGISGGYQERAIPVNRLVAYINKKEGGNWLGRSILRPAYKNWLIKDRLLRVQAQTIERNGMGIPTYEAAETEQDLSKGLGLATSLRAGEAAGAAIPNGAKLRLMGVEGQLPDAEPAIRYHDEQIARAVLAHFLNLGTQTGSWALGTTFADFFTLSLQTLAQQVADTATQHIVEDIVDLNWGESEPAPKVVFDEIGSRQAATAEAIKSLIDAGVITPDEVLEGAVRQQFGLPRRDENTERAPEQAITAAPQPETRPDERPGSVAAAMADPKADAAGAADLDEEADDWEDAIDALILALDEIDSERVEARAFDPAKHPRNPKGSPGGGRFRSMVDRLKDAIEEHLNGDGKGHPFDDFDREQLRRVARARGIELRRGEDKDSIAKKLLDHLGRKDQPKAAPKKKAAPRPKKPARLTPAQELDRWKAEASKPGRVPVAGSGPTKREEYVASWERGIASTRKDIAEAEASGQQHRLPDLKKYLDYQTKGRDAIRDNPDPSLDEPLSGPSFKLAQKVNAGRPLAVYGDVLHLEGSDDAWIHANLTELERVPAELHGVVAAHMAARADGGIWVGDTAVSRMDHSHDLAGVTPRGWGDGRTFDDVNGVYRPDRRVMLVGRTANSEHRGDKTASHEFGHALDDALGGPSAGADWEAIHSRALASQHLSPYYRQSGHAGRNEFWAEAFSAWVSARQRQPGYDTRATYVIRLNVSAETGDLIHDYFNRVAAKWGVS